jgi:Neprosin
VVVRKFSVGLATLALAAAGIAGLVTFSATQSAHAATRKAPPPDFSSAKQGGSPPSGSRRQRGALTLPGQAPPAQQCDIAYQRYGACYDYAGGTVAEPNQGATVTFPVTSPTLASNGSHTLMEMAVFNRTPAGIDEDTAEVGWIVNRPSSGQPPVPHLFVYHFVNTQGTCYNGCGFVSTSTTIVPGMALTPGTDVTWSIRNIAGNWTFFFNGTEFGYIPDSAYDGTFDQASIVNVYGEIAGGGTTPGCSQMGNGLFSTQQDAATISNFQLYDPATNAQLTPYWPTDPAAWNSTVIKNGFRVGGPGDCKPMAGTVATGSGDYTVVGQDTSAYAFTEGDNPWTRPNPLPAPQVTGAGQIVGVTSDPATGGYWMTDNQGDVYPVNAPDYGGLNGAQTPTPVVGITAFGSGYLLVTANGMVYGFNTTTYGDLTSVTLKSPVVGITAFGSGYLIATAGGKVYSFNTSYYGSARLAGSSAPITGIAADGNGYLLVDSAGDVYAFHAPYQGSLRGTEIPEPVIGITPTSTGYLLTDTGGNVYAFNTPFDGSVTDEGI